LRIISWNINQRAAAWHELVNSDVDVALFQEAKLPPPELTSLIEIDQPPPWYTAGIGNSRSWRAAIARLSDRVSIIARKVGPIGSAQLDELAVSLIGTLAVADVVGGATGEVITVVSMYGVSETPSKDMASCWMYADASVHRSSTRGSVWRLT
jgi:hypothetical protein